MDFDRANTEVTRRSYGSRVDKTFQREGVIPIKDRKKDNRDYAAESAKYNELNKKVENRRLNDVKEQKAFDMALSKGYENLRESLIRDVMCEICIESMLVDRNDIDNNIQNVMSMVNEQVDEIGGYKGFKQIAESTGNKLLLNIINTCDEMTKIIGNRNIMEAAGNASKLDFEMTKSEMDEFDYRKKSFGSETIVNAVRDKVLDVVKYEQEANTSKQEVMDEIQAKVSELGAPVGEAMEFIFGQKVEETTLFDSLMRKNYKNLLATESSFIFESKGVEEDDFEYEDEDFKMSDIELIDEEDEDAIRDMFLENAYNNIVDSENLEEELNSILETLKVMTNCKSKSEAMRMKDDIRYLQLQIMEGKGYPAGADCTANNVPKEAVKNAKKVKEEVIICPDCGKDPCTCKGVKESFEPIVEGVLKNKIVMAFDKYKHKKLNKVDFDKLRNNMIQITANAKTIKELDVLERDVDFSIAELEKMKKPENEEKITFHVEFLNNEYKKFLAEKRKEMEDKQCLESFVDKLDDYCDKLSHIIETHELARNSVMESLTYTIEGESVFVPFIQPNDCNLSNLEFAYKTKTVCESLKSELKNVRNENDFMIIEKAVQMNLQSIHEAMSCIENMEKMDYKKHVLNSCEGYLNKIQHVIDNNSAPNNSVVESTSVFEDEEAVEMIFNRVKEHTLIESTSNNLMELVMAESIVEYTIMEAFNTLNLLKFDKESVRRMSRNNISSTTEGFLGKY